MSCLTKITLVRASVRELVALVVKPRGDNERIGHEARNRALHQRVIAENDVLLAHVSLVGLNYNCETRNNIYGLRLNDERGREPYLKSRLKWLLVQTFNELCRVRRSLIV